MIDDGGKARLYLGHEDVQILESDDGLKFRRTGAKLPGAYSADKEDGDRLQLNIDTGSAGTAFVELQDADGKPIPGFTLADCEEIGGNFIDQSVYWKGKTDVSSLAGKPVRIHFKMKRARLSAFPFDKE